MGNCLVTKLKGIVNNPNLPKLGELVVQARGLTSATGQNINCYNGVADAMKYKLDDGYSFNTIVWNGSAYAEGASSGLNEVEVTGVNNTLFSAGYCIPSGYTGKVRISPKYQIIKFDLSQNDSSVELNIEDLKYCPLTSFTAASKAVVNGDIGVFKDSTTLTTLMVSSSYSLGGDIKDIPVSITDFQAVTTSVEGSINNLGNHVNLVRLWINNSNITGTIEQFVAAQVAAGRTSGTVAVDIHASQVTYQGRHTSSFTQNLVWENGVITSFPVEFAD